MTIEPPFLKLKRVELKNILSFKDAVFEDIEQFGILIGKNNSGKSNFIKVFRMLKLNEIMDNSYFFTNVAPIHSSIKIVFELSLKLIEIIKEKITNIYQRPKSFFEGKLRLFSNSKIDDLSFNELMQHLTVRIGFDENNYARLQFFGLEINLKDQIHELPFTHTITEMYQFNWRQEKNSINLSKNEIFNAGNIFQYNKIKEIYHKGENPQSLIPYYHFLNFLRNIQYIEDFRYFKPEVDIALIDDKIDPQGSNLPHKIYQFYNIRSKQSNLKKIDELLKRFYPNLKEIGQDLSSKKIRPYVVEAGLQELRKLDFIGRGLQQLVVIIVHLLELEEQALLFIEEPEVNLHPAMQKTMLDLFHEFLPNRQIIISTHSPFFYKKLSKNTSVHQIVKESEESKVNKIQYEELVHTITDIGVEPSDLFLFEKILFVEGESDKQVIEVLCEKLGFDLFTHKANIIPLGSVKNYVHYSTSTTLKFLQDHGVKIWFLLDRDERDDEDVKKLEEKLKDFPNAECHVLEKREMENYFLNPKLLSRFFQKSISTPTEDQAELFDEKNMAREIFNIIKENGDFYLGKQAYEIIGKPLYIDAKRVFGRNGNEIDFTQFEAEFNRIQAEIKARKEYLNVDIQHFQAEWKDRIQNKSFDQIEFEDGYIAKIYNRFPGNKILEGLFSRFSKKYSKTRHLKEIAKMIQPDEIILEFSNFLDEIFKNHKEMTLEGKV